MAAERFVPSRGCASCPFRAGPCHSARQHAMDQVLDVGRHYDCEYFTSLRARGIGLPPLGRRRRSLPREWGALLRELARWIRS
jgi:hypothetical protein